MPKAPTQTYTDLQTALTALRTGELNARAAGDRDLESVFTRARKEIADPRDPLIPKIRRDNP